MATWRKRSKSGGITRTSTSKGWTTSTSYGAGKKGGLGHRVTTTHRADGKTVVRTTERANGWHKTTQRTLSSKDPYKLTKRDLNISHLGMDQVLDMSSFSCLAFGHLLKC